MPTLTRQEVEEIALLARLHLEPDEVDRMQGELGAILDHFAALAAVDTTGVAPLTHVAAVGTSSAASALRPDEVQPSLAPEVALKGAPKRDGDLIVVPAILERGGS